jgi:hypothetical protein
MNRRHSAQPWLRAQTVFIYTITRGCNAGLHVNVLLLSVIPAISSSTWGWRIEASVDISFKKFDSAWPAIDFRHSRQSVTVN